MEELTFGTPKFVLDIETAPLDNAIDYLEDPKPPKNYKDPDKIAEHIEKKRQSDLDGCALHPDLCQVIAVARISDQAQGIQIYTSHGGHEKHLLSALWSDIGEGAHIIGFNVLWDLRVLLRRSLYLGVPAPDIQLGRYRHPQVTDLMEILSYGDIDLRKSLEFYAKRFGVGKTVHSGSEIPDLFKAASWGEIIAHVREDVYLTAKIAEKMGHFRNWTGEDLARESLESAAVAG